MFARFIEIGWKKNQKSLNCFFFQFLVERDDTILQGHMLPPGKKLTSMSGEYKVLMGEDGNLLILGKNDETIWQSGSQLGENQILKGFIISIACMGGEPIVIDTDNDILWHIQEGEVEFDYMVIEDDGFFKGYKDGIFQYSLPETES